MLRDLTRELVVIVAAVIAAVIASLIGWDRSDPSPTVVYLVEPTVAAVYFDVSDPYVEEP